MLKWIKEKFSKKNKFTGFKIEVYRDGKLLPAQKGKTNKIRYFNSGHYQIMFEGVALHGYTLTPPLESK
jgi:hypothetical protein